jgi:hypothetical protein
MLLLRQFGSLSGLFAGGTFNLFPAQKPVFQQMHKADSLCIEACFGLLLCIMCSATRTDALPLGYQNSLELGLWGF